MKKFLLIAAMAALALGASADGYKLEKVWERADVASLFTSGVRQGFAVDGKFYINDTEWATGGGTGEPKFYVYGETGEPTIIDGFSNTAVSADEAGHILVSTAAFSANIAGSSVKVLDRNTLEVLAEYEIPEECGLNGRCDFFGVAQGDMTTDGVMYLTGGNTNSDPYTQGVAVLAVSDGEIDFDNSFLAPIDGTYNGQTSTVINYYKDLNGDDALIYAYRSGAPTKLMYDGTVYKKTPIVLPGKGFSNGIFPFVWDGKELFIYPYKGTDAVNYLDGWAIAEADAAEPLVVVPSTVAAAANGYQNNWLNAEIDENGVTIYQYYPGGYVRVYRLTKDEPVPVTPDVYLLGGNMDNWVPTEGVQMTYNEESNNYTLNITFDGRHDGYNYFGFTNELAENDDEGGWAYIEPFRFGAVADPGTDFDVTEEQLNKNLTLTYDEYHAFKIPAGEYNLTVSLENLTLFIEKVNAGLRGDVNGDDAVNISDVTALINYLLSKNPAGINLDNADCDLNETVSISDVTSLINYLLSKNW